MRVLSISFLALLPGAVGAASPAPVPAVAIEPGALPTPDVSNCPRTTTYHAFDTSKPVAPRKLNELPRAQGFMAVHRRLDGCEVPLTIIEYRNAGGR